MATATFSIDDERMKKLVYIITYYGTTLSELIKGYVDYLVLGNIPHGYEQIYQTEVRRERLSTAIAESTGLDEEVSAS
jgi:hypothetical protein